MSRWTFPTKAGIVLSLAAFVVGITAASALGWGTSGGQENEKPPVSTTPKHNDEHNNKDEDEHEGKGKNKGGHEQPQPQPEQPAGQPAPPAAPPAAAPPAPVVSQGAPAAPPAAQPVQTETLAPGEREVPENPVVAQAPPQGGVPTAPVAERKQLARTGLDPALIALLGAMCLGGGGLLFRRALTRG